MKRVSYVIFFGLLAIPKIVFGEQGDNDNSQQLEHKKNMAEKKIHRNLKYWCNRLRDCKPDNTIVCGWDEEESFLAQFENICVLYRANCRGAGSYHLVEAVICETKIKYDAEHPDGDELEWIHIENGTSAASTVNTAGTADKEALRHMTEFRTLYSEGGTLPAGFFDNDDRQSTTKQPKLSNNN